ncbi:hypothetical protein [Hyphomonas sp.]|uniref:hypothetical protein n=1 Tax=Hyphomonas sp. TaxID=87 RepID=UPI00391C6A59
MSAQKPVPVPAPSRLRFENGIAHPELWLWDSWTAVLDGRMHLYCLALSRTDADGQSISQAERNNYPFHIRHFTSRDGGTSWQDEGAFLTPQTSGDGAFERNVWSGCMLARTEGEWLCGFTGLRALTPERPFLQTICLGQSHDGFRLDTLPAAALSCPIRDYDAIREAGYYLPAADTLGAAEGEEGGPILAWRDPFIVAGSAGTLEVFWSAKMAPARSAVAHATVVRDGEDYVVETLHPPMTLPDDTAFTQAEVPKLYFDAAQKTWYLLISACDRLSEEQPADEVTKELRLYKSSSMRGPWTGAFAGGASRIPGTGFLFGASILSANFSAGQFTLIGPYTEYAPADKQLTFAPRHVIDLPREGAEPLAGLRNRPA